LRFQDLKTVDLLRFEHPIYLVVLTLAPVMVVLFLGLLRWKKRTISRIGDEALIRQLIAGYSPKKFLWKFILVITAFAMTGLGLANLQTPLQMEQVQRQGVDVMIVLDVSKSMLAKDVQPSRLDRARQMTGRLIDRLRNDRIGIVIFAGRAYLQMPLTTDHAAAKMYLNTAGPESVPTQGTVIGEALQVAANAFGTADKKFKTIILVTDGEDHDDQALDLARKLSEEGVLLHTIGVGTSEGATLADAVTQEQKRDPQGNVVISRLNEPVLQQLSQTANGVYIRLDDTESAVKLILDQIDSMEKRAIVDPTTIRYRSFFQWFLALALALLIFDFFLSERKKTASA
jgi:Ca-activated chloride channel family protein